MAYTMVGHMFDPLSVIGGSNVLNWINDGHIFVHELSKLDCLYWDTL